MPKKKRHVVTYGDREYEYELGGRGTKITVFIDGEGHPGAIGSGNPQTAALLLLTNRVPFSPGKKAKPLKKKKASSER